KRGARPSRSLCPASRLTARAADSTHRLVLQGKSSRLVGGTPTRAVETTALPLLYLHRSGELPSLYSGASTQVGPVGLGRRMGMDSIMEIEQTENSALITFAEPERPFDAKVQVERVGTLRRQQAGAENIRQSGRWKGIIATVYDPLPEPVRLPTQSSERGPANQTRHNRRVAIEIFVAAHHADEIRIIIFRIKKSARAAMGCDHGDALRESTLQPQRIGELLGDYCAGMFVAGVEHQNHTQLAGQPIKRVDLAPLWSLS